MCDDHHEAVCSMNKKPFVQSSAKCALFFKLLVASFHFFLLTHSCLVYHRNTFKINCLYTL